MYQVYFDEELVYKAGSEELVLYEPVVDLEVNKSGSFTFRIPASNPHSDRLKELITIIRVSKDGTDIFRGRCIDIVVDFYGTKSVMCEGELAFLLDSIQPPGEFRNITVRNFLRTLLEKHNEQVDIGSGNNLSITFHADCRGESANYDYLYLYYYDASGKCQVVLDKVQANVLAGKTYVIPSTDFYIYWRTDGSQNNYYGFSIDAVKKTNAAITASTQMEVPLAVTTEKIETSDITKVQTEHNPYLNNQTTQWHYTFVGIDKTFQVGSITVIDNNDSLYRYTNWENTLEAIKDKLVSRLGGYLRIRYSGGIRYLDYIADYTHVTEQVIEFGENLLDYSQNIDATDIATAVIPLGARQEESPIAALEAYLTIESVNDGKTYVHLPSAVTTYGWIFKIVNFDDVHMPVNLKRKGEEYLTEVQFANMILELTAIDLSLLDKNIEQILLGDIIRCRSPVHSLDMNILVSARSYHLDAPEEDSIILGTKMQKSMSERNVSSNQELIDRLIAMPTKQSILEEARDNATQIMNSATHGYVVTTADEQLIMDTRDVNTAIRLWRWNINGLAYSERGYGGPYKVAITMDGTIMGEMIAAGSIVADKIDIGYRTSVETLVTDKSTAAERAANNYTDTTLRTSYWTKTEVQSSITNTANEIRLAITKVEEANLFDYVLNGNFTEGADGFTAWYKPTNPAPISVVDNTTLGRCVSVAKTTSSNYIRQTLMGLQAGEYIIRYKAATTSAYTGSARVQCTFNNSAQVSPISLKANEWTTFERKVTLSAGGNIYIYLYCYTNNTTVFIKDIEVLGNLARYTKSQFLVTDENIKAEVTRATNAETLLASSIKVSADSIVQSVREALAFNAYDYVINGNFSAATPLSNWTLSDTTGIITATTYQSKKCVLITTGTSYYIRQTFTGVKLGRYRVSLKVATTADYVATARVRVNFNSTNFYSVAGEIKEDYTTFEYEFEVTSAGTKYVYIYNYRSGAPIYVTDIKLLSAYEIYSQAQLTVLSDEIRAEVTRATTKENALQSSITLAENSIRAEVTRATNRENALQSSITLAENSIRAEVTRATSRENALQSSITLTENSIKAEVTRATTRENTLSSSITANANNITLKVSRGNVSSEITAESGSVSIRSNRMTIASTNFSVTGSGTVTSKGSFTTETGSYRSVLTSGYINFYYGNTLTGRLSAQARAIGSNTGNVMDLEGNQRGTIFSIGSTYYYALNNGLNPSGNTQRHYFSGTQFFGGLSYMDQVRWRSNTSTYIGYGTLNGQGGMYSYASIYAQGMLASAGTKYRIVDTDNFGKIGMNAMESTGANFADIGSASIGEDGSAYIFLDPVFAEVIDRNYEYQVFITQTSEQVTHYVEKYPDYFIVHGEEKATFDWQVIARQRDYQNHYMESVDIGIEETIEYDDSIFYEDDLGALASEEYMKEFVDNLDEEAFLYLEEYEREVESYD